MKTSRLITYDELRSLKGIPYGRMQLTRLMEKSEFPQCVQLTANRIAWYESEIDAWIASRKRGKADDLKADFRRTGKKKTAHVGKAAQNG